LPTILVTGAAGYLGSHVTDALLARGEQVVGLDNFDPTHPRAEKLSNLASALASPGFELFEGNICSAEIMAHLFSTYQPDRVIHLAARAGVRDSIAEPEEYLSVNVAGTLQVLKAAERAQVRKLVFTSSSSVYGVGAVAPFREDQPLGRPASPYAASKIAAEAYCHVAHHLHGLPVVVVRIFNPIGPRQRPGMALRTFAQLMLAGEPIPMYGDGSSSRDYTYVGDVVDGILAALDADLAYEVINLGHNHPVPLSHLIATLGEALGVELRVERLPEQPGDIPVTCADIEKARRLLGWEPTLSFEEAVGRFVEWFRAR
jgi:UDP-glucuronate 4-epimerase